MNDEPLACDAICKRFADAPARGREPAKHACFTAAVKPSAFVRSRISEEHYAERYYACLKAISEEPKCRLYELYKPEYNSFRGCRQRAKAKHLKFDNRLTDFRDWLTHLGPRPADGWTVDRINPSKGYECANVRWATKTEQTQNRKVTKWHNVDGQHLTTRQLAKQLDVPYDTLYKRLRRGWTIKRLLDHEKKGKGLEGWRFPSEWADILEPLYQRRSAYAQPRIRWYIGHLEKIIDRSWKKDEKELTPLFEALDQAQNDLNAILSELDNIAQAEVDELLARVKPPPVSGFDSGS